MGVSDLESHSFRSLQYLKFHRRQHDYTRLIVAVTQILATPCPLPFRQKLTHWISNLQKGRHSPLVDGSGEIFHNLDDVTALIPSGLHSVRLKTFINVANNFLFLAQSPLFF